MFKMINKMALILRVINWN